MPRTRGLAPIAAGLVLATAALAGAAWSLGRDGDGGAVPFTAIPDYALAGYTFTESHEDLMRELPCYCGCRERGHQSLYQCFIRPRGGYDSHAFNCTICLDEAARAQQLLAEGADAVSIRVAIDAEFAGFGPPTTP